MCLDREVASDTTQDVMQICGVNSAHKVSKSENISEVPGAHDFLSARSMSFSDHKTMTSVIGSSQVWLALFTIIITTIPSPDQSRGTALRFLNG